MPKCGVCGRDEHYSWCSPYMASELRAEVANHGPIQAAAGFGLAMLCIVCFLNVDLLPAFKIQDISHKKPRFLTCPKNQKFQQQLATADQHLQTSARVTRDSTTTHRPLLTHPHTEACSFTHSP